MEKRKDFEGGCRHSIWQGLGGLNKQAGASQIWQERPTAKSHMTNIHSESTSELPVMFLLEGY